jgi:hypothetical protein
LPCPAVTPSGRRVLVEPVEAELVFLAELAEQRLVLAVEQLDGGLEARRRVLARVGWVDVAYPHADAVVDHDGQHRRLDPALAERQDRVVQQEQHEREQQRADRAQRDPHRPRAPVVR